MWAFYFLAALVVWQSIISLRGGLSYLAYVRREIKRDKVEQDEIRLGKISQERLSFTPFASVIVPCRGLDQGLQANLNALFNQRYPAYEIIFVADNADDPALRIVKELLRTAKGNGVGAGTISTRVVIAGPANQCGQKVHNLRVAVRKVDPASEVLVFVDTDARPGEEWLRSLIGPLKDGRIGATTGYRWFVPVAGGLWSHLRAVWNASIASALGERGDRNFCWGGATAIRQETFAGLDIMEQWRGTLSDDFALTRALRVAKLPVHFVPACLTLSHEDCTFTELVEFTTRQIKITRVYAAHLWKIVLASNLIFVAVFFGGGGIVFARAALGLPVSSGLLLGELILTIYALGTLKAYFRLRAVGLAVGAGPGASSVAQVWRAAPVAAHLFLWPLTSILYLYNAVAAAFSRRIIWRGITYELKSATETAIIFRDQPNVETAKVKRRAHRAS